jgi:arsenical pump membrane protein
LAQSSAGPARLLLAAGAVAAVAAAVADPSAASKAASQDWPPFVLVAGLLMVGLVAAEDRLFEAAGERLAGSAKDGRVLFAGVAALVVTVSAVLNLDTSVAFLSPVLVHTARKRGDGEVILLSGCLLLSNAGSLLLPGSNLTNLIVLGHLHLSGGRFASRMGLPWIAACAVTAIVVAVSGRRALRSRFDPGGVATKPVIGLGASAVAAVTILIVVLPSPALPVLAVGGVSLGWRLARRTQSVGAALEVVGLPVLLGLFGIAIGLGALGRDWSGPTHLLRHLDPLATAAVAAVVSVAVNNLPAASLLAARVPAHPYSLLIGLNLGPNLFVTGSLSWILWLRASQAAGGNPSIRRTALMGVVAVPLSIAAAVAVLSVVTSSG